MSTPLEQLPKLLRMLSSNHDAEVLVAARKIHAAMVSNDWDWDQLLSNGSAHTFSEEQLQKVFAAGLQKGDQLGYERGFAEGQATLATTKPTSIEIANDADWLQQLLDAAQNAEAAGALDTFEKDITRDHRDKLLRFGRRMYISQRQFNSFKRLERKLQRHGFL